MAHWNETRDAHMVELMRGISYLPKDLVDRYEQTGDNVDFAEIIDFLRSRPSCDSQK
jgi:hypothetical protein